MNDHSPPRKRRRKPRWDRIAWHEWAVLVAAIGATLVAGGALLYVAARASGG